MNTAREISSPRLIVPGNTAEKKTRKSPRASAPKAPKGAPGVVEQVRIAFHPKNRLAALFGCLIGGGVPAAVYVAAHFEVDFAAESLRDWAHTVAAMFLVAGGLLFSAKTVYQWGKLAFQESGKALGFVVLTELVMIVSRTQWLGLAALVYLVGINAVATGCILSLRSRAQ